MPPHSITTLSLTPPRSTSHHGTHNTPRNHACVLWCLLFACRCLCVSLSARSFLTQPKPRHAIQSPYPPHTALPMHEPMSKWEGSSGVFVDTTTQTPATTTKSRCHPHHLLSFLPFIGPPHYSQHHHQRLTQCSEWAEHPNTKRLTDLPTTHRALMHM